MYPDKIVKHLEQETMTIQGQSMSGAAAKSELEVRVVEHS